LASVLRARALSRPGPAWKELLLAADSSQQGGDELERGEHRCRGGDPGQLGDLGAVL